MPETISTSLVKAFAPMRETIALWLFLMVTSLASLMFIGYRSERVMAADTLAAAQRAANLTAILMDVNRHSEFARSGKMWSEEHKVLLKPLIDFHKRFPNTGRVRTVVQSGSSVIVVLDTETVAGPLGLNRPVNPQELGTVLQPGDPEASLASDSIASQTARVASEARQNPWGNFLSAAAPLGNNGAVIASIDVTAMDASRQQMIDVVLVGVGISLIMATVIALGFFNMRTTYVSVASAGDDAKRGHEWQQNRNRKLVEALGQIALHRDLKNRCLLWSGDSEGLLAIPRGKMPLESENWISRIHPEDASALQSAIQSAIRGRKIFEVEYRVKTGAGDWKWFSERGVVTFAADDHDALSVDSVLLDVTDRKTAAERLAALALIASRTDNAVCLTQSDGRIEWVNDAFLRISGFSREESVGRLFAEIVRTSAKDGFIVEAVASAAEKRAQITEVELIRKSGEEYWSHLEVQPLMNEEGKVIKLVAIQSDRTASKEFQERLVNAKDAAEAADRAKSDFLAVMSHEVRTPLNAVLGFTSLLMDSPLNEQQRDYLQTIRSSGDSLLLLVNDILDFSKMEAEKFILEKSRFDLRQCLEASLEVLGHAAASKGLELICDLAPETPPTILGDQARLRQVILNLAGNAVKFTDSGEVVIGVRVVGRQGDSARLRFEVRDTGPGISAEQQAALFKPFSQADSTATRRHGGTGLGLAISKRLVKLMGGEIGLESVPGHGSVFWFELPAETSHDRDLDFSTLSPLRGRTVLLVEKNTTLRAVLTNQLTRWGMQVKGFARGREAIFAAEQRRFDVALMDFATPDIDGVRLAERLRRTPRGGVDRILLMGPPGAEGELPVSMETTGMVQVLLKPIRTSALSDALLRGLPTRPEALKHYASSQTESDSSGANPGNGPWATPLTTSPAVSDAKPTGLRILVTDDNAINRKLVGKMLSKLGYQTVMAENGVQAVQAVRESRFDLILMDLQMPEMDGLEATRQIRKGGLTLPIIAVTADAMPDDQARCRNAGMNDYLPKPVRPEALVAALERALNNPSV